MLPFLKGGQDRVTLSPVNSPVGKGDVLFYRRDGGAFVLHRVVRVLDGENFLTCGDNQFVLEKGITDKHILAKMKAVIRDGKTIDESVPEYVKYVKKLPYIRFKKRVRNKLSAIKNKIFKKKTV